MTPNRRNMNPATMETIIFLKSNHDLWNGALIERILIHETRRLREEARKTNDEAKDINSDVSEDGIEDTI